MPQDWKLSRENGYYDLSVKNGQISRTNGLETAIAISLFSKQRARGGSVTEPMNREGHFLDIFRTRSAGNLSWLKLTQGRLDTNTINFIQSEYTRALQWLVDDGICTDVNVAINSRNNELNAIITLTSGSSEDTLEYDLLINTNDN